MQEPDPRADMPFDASSRPTTPEVTDISSIFHVGANLDDRSVDLLVLSSDHVLFVVHSHRILSASTNHFASLIAPTSQNGGGVPASPVNADTMIPGVPAAMPILNVDTPSDALNLVFHCVYDLSPVAYLPSLQCLISLLPHLTHYGLTPLSRYLSNDTLLFNMFLLHAKNHPIAVYAFAVSQGLENLAVATSEHTLALDLSNSISPHYANLMGTKYLFKLYKLHGTRLDAIKTILGDTDLPPHAGHCSLVNREQAKSVVTLACHRLYRESSPGMPRATMESIMHAELRAIACTHCMQSAEGLLESICSRWLLVARTIEY